MVAWNDVVDALDRQDGVIGKADLEALGIGRHRLSAWVTERRLERAAPRVWRLAGAPVTWRQRLRVGLLALGPMSWVSHEAAAQLHRFDRTPIDRVEFLVLRRRRDVRLPERVRSTRRWGPVDAVEVDGLRATSATRTILDLANAGAGRTRVEAAVDSAIRLELSSPEAIRLRLGAIRCRGWNGVRRLEDALDHAGGHTMLERRFLELMGCAGLPRPETRTVFRDERDGRFVARVDFYYPDSGVVIEVTGRVGHSTPEDRMRDAQRRNELQDLGLRVYEFTWEDVTRRSVFVVSQMRKALGSPTI